MKPEHRHSLRNGVNKLLRARPGETGLVVTVAGGITSADLTPATRASGPHAFAVRARVARLATLLASIAFHPAFVAIASRPSLGWNARIIVFDSGCRQAKFCKSE